MEFELVNEAGNIYYLSEVFTITVVKKKTHDIFSIYRKKHYCLSLYDLELAKHICEVMQNDFIAHKERVNKKFTLPQKWKYKSHIQINENERHDKYVESKATKKQIELINEFNKEAFSE